MRTDSSAFPSCRVVVEEEGSWTEPPFPGECQLIFLSSSLLFGELDSGPVGFGLGFRRHFAGDSVIGSDLFLGLFNWMLVCGRLKSITSIGKCRSHCFEELSI